VLGIVVIPAAGSKIFLKSPISLRTSTDFGIESPVTDQPNTTMIGPATASIQITSTTLTLFGTPPGAAMPFMTNPTSCKPATTTLDAVSYETPGTTATKSDTFTPTDCDKLPFAPAITATMGAPGATAKGSNVPFTATVTQAVGEASQLSTAVTLPPALVSGTNVSGLCSTAQLAAAACPDASRIGTATISSPLLPLPVQGPVFAVLRPAQLPGVGVEFGGTLPFVLSGASALAPGGRLQNVFTGLPDVPLTSFALAIDGGPHGLLVSNTDLCTATGQTAVGAFTGQNGGTADVTVPVKVVGCGSPRATPRVSASLTGRKGATPLRSLSISLPKTLKVKKVRGGVTAVGAKFKLGKRSIRLTRSGVLRLRLPSRGASRVTATLSKGSFVAKKSLRAKLRKHRTVKVRLVIRTVDSALKRATVRKTVSGRR
jgi:hypothetical protein